MHFCVVTRELFFFLNQHNIIVNDFKWRRWSNWLWLTWVLSCHHSVLMVNLIELVVFILSYQVFLVVVLFLKIIDTQWRRKGGLHKVCAHWWIVSWTFNQFFYLAHYVWLLLVLYTTHIAMHTVWLLLVLYTTHIAMHTMCCCYWCCTLHT